MTMHVSGSTLIANATRLLLSSGVDPDGSASRRISTASGPDGATVLSVPRELLSTDFYFELYRLFPDVVVIGE